MRTESSATATSPAEGVSHGATAVVQPGRARPERSPQFGRWLLAIVIVGLALRLTYVVALEGRSVADDGFNYLAGAQALVDGDGFINPFTGDEDARNPPGWRLVLALPKVVGIEGLLAVQIYQALLGVAAVVAVGFAGRRIVNDRVGLVAAAIAAIYPGIWTYERELHSETGVIGGVAVLLLLAYRFRDRPTLGRAVALGLALGVLTLVRAEAVMLAAFLVAPLILTDTAVDWRRRTSWLAAAGAATALVVAPWTLYNLSRFEKPVLISSGLGTAMAQGNCDAAYYGKRFGTYQFRCLITALGPSERGGVLDSSEIDAKAQDAAITYARDHLDRLPAVLVARQGRTWGAFRPAQQIGFDSQSSKTPTSVGWAAMIGYWILLPRAVVGAVRLRHRSVPVWPILVVVAAVAVTTTITFGQTRYRAMAEVPIVLLAATSLEWFWDRWRNQAADPDAG